jgi:prepilin-type N-terminal cleavage/methylation domain-containing protein
MPRLVGHLERHIDRRRRARRTARGDSLIEVLIAVVIIGAIFAAFFAAISTSSSTSAAHRDFVTADALLRDYAEAAKAAARADCPTSATYTTTTTSLPTGFTVSNGEGFVGTDGICPGGPTSVQRAALLVTMPNGVTKSLEIDVRAP